MKLTKKQQQLPLTKKIREAIIREVAEQRTANIMDDGFESVYELVTTGTTGLDSYSDEDLLAAILPHLEV